MISDINFYLYLITLILHMGVGNFFDKQRLQKLRKNFWEYSLFFSRRGGRKRYLKENAHEGVRICASDCSLPSGRRTQGSRGRRAGTSASSSPASPRPRSLHPARLSSAARRRPLAPFLSGLRRRRTVERCRHHVIIWKMAKSLNVPQKNLISNFCQHVLDHLSKNGLVSALFSLHLHRCWK